MMVELSRHGSATLLFSSANNNRGMAVGSPGQRCLLNIGWELCLLFSVGNIETFDSAVRAMNGWVDLGKEQSVFPGCLHAPALYLSLALALFSFVKAPPAYAQQVIEVPPFVGTNSETWERFNVAEIPSETSILGGIATISGDHMVTAHSFLMCTVIGIPHDGNILMDSDRPTGPVSISFSQPVSAFGAYWGSGVGCPECCGFGDAPSILTFLDAAGNIIGTDSFFYDGTGALAWHGYQFGTPAKTITRTAGDGLEGFAMDGLQANVAAATPTPTPTPTPGCYPNFTTAGGCDALDSVATGAGNTALGWRSLFLDTTGGFSTGVGGGALALNNADSNTGVGAAALLLNTSSTQNTAVGTDALVFNDSGSSNTATGYFSLMNNTTGGSNTAIGSEALTANTTGSNNTAIGNLALTNSQTTSDHVCVGSDAGSGISAANDNNIIIGHHSGVHSVFGQESDRCFVDNIFGASVSAATAAMVMVDSDGRLSTVTADGPDPGGSSLKGIRPKVIPNATKQAMLNFQVQELEAKVTQQQKQVETLTAQLKKQAAQIHKVNAELEMRKPSAKMIVNKPKAVSSGKVHGQLEQ
jgi:hypothetical protein